MLVCLLGILSLKGVSEILRFPAVSLSVGLHDACAAADKNTTKNVEFVAFVTIQKILLPPECEMELMVKAAGSVMERCLDGIE